MRSVFIAGCAVLVAASVARASLTSVDLNTLGDGKLSLDSVTGLKWLDLDQTTGFSYDQMNIELQPGGLFDGFRRASTAEVDAFYTSAGILTRGYVAAEAPNISALLAINGTLQTGFRIGSSGFTSNAIGLGHEITSHFLAPNESFGAYVAAFNNGSAVDWFAFSDTGHWLVQTPSPGAASLFAIGGLVATRRRRA